VLVSTHLDWQSPSPQSQDSRHETRESPQSDETVENWELQVEFAHERQVESADVGDAQLKPLELPSLEPHAGTKLSVRAKLREGRTRNGAILIASSFGGVGRP
jgi:hypothetical protein